MTPRLVVLTGGPGAGKTAVLEIARHALREVVVLPESAGIVFGGGFPRRADLAAREAAQRAIYFVQRELERLARVDAAAPIVLCDRGTIDALAYWPYGEESFFASVGTTLERELAHYDLVLHLHVPSVRDGYRMTGLRIETADEAAGIDRRIEQAWRSHPNRIEIPAEHDFVHKAQLVLAALREEIAQVSVL